MQDTLADAIRAGVAALEADYDSAGKEADALRAALETLCTSAAPHAIDPAELARIEAAKAAAEGRRAFLVEVDPLLCVRVYARDAQEAEQRACDQLAGDDFEGVTTCSEIGSNVQDVREESD